MPYVDLDTSPSGDFPTSRPLSSAKLRQLAENVESIYDSVVGGAHYIFNPPGSVGTDQARSGRPLNANFRRANSDTNDQIKKSFSLETHGYPLRIIVDGKINPDSHVSGGGAYSWSLSSGLTVTLSIKIGTLAPIIIRRITGGNTSYKHPPRVQERPHYVTNLSAGTHNISIHWIASGATTINMWMPLFFEFKEVPVAPTIAVS